MGVDKADPRSHQPSGLDEAEELIVLRRPSPREGLEKRKDLGSVAQMPEGNLSNDERMTEYHPVQKQFPQMDVSLPEVGNPD